MYSYIIRYNYKFTKKNELTALFVKKISFNFKLSFTPVFIIRNARMDSSFLIVKPFVRSISNN